MWGRMEVSSNIRIIARLLDSGMREEDDEMESLKLQVAKCVQFIIIRRLSSVRTLLTSHKCCG